MNKKTCPKCGLTYIDYAYGDPHDERNCELRCLRFRLAAANARADGVEKLVSELVSVLEFYADDNSWKSPSSGFARQYDPKPSPIEKAGKSKLAKDIIAKLRGGNEQ